MTPASGPDRRYGPRIGGGPELAGDAVGSRQDLGQLASRRRTK